MFLKQASSEKKAQQRPKRSALTSPKTSPTRSVSSKMGSPPASSKRKSRQRVKRSDLFFKENDRKPEIAQEKVHDASLSPINCLGSSPVDPVDPGCPRSTTLAPTLKKVHESNLGELEKNNLISYFSSQCKRFNNFATEDKSPPFVGGKRKHREKCVQKNKSSDLGWIGMGEKKVMIDLESTPEKKQKKEERCSEEKYGERTTKNFRNHRGKKRENGE